MSSIAQSSLVILSREVPLLVILSREATKGSLSIQGC